MKKYIIFIACFLGILSGRAIGADEVVLPDIEALGKDMNDCIHFLGGTASSSRKYPKQLVVDADKNNKIIGIMVHYDKSVSLSAVESSINALYGEWVTVRTENPPGTLWRITPEKVAIQLSLDSSLDGSNLVRLIILPFRDSTQSSSMTPSGDVSKNP